MSLQHPITQHTLDIRDEYHYDGRLDVHSKSDGCTDVSWRSEHRIEAVSYGGATSTQIVVNDREAVKLALTLLRHVLAAIPYSVELGEYDSLPDAYETCSLPAAIVEALIP